VSLRDQFQTDMIAATKAREQTRLDCLRMAIAAFRKKEIDETKKPLTDPEVIAIVNTLIKQRRESVEMYRKGNRQDLLDKETAEIAVLESYLPKQLDDAGLNSVIDAAIAETGAAGMKDMGKVISVLKERFAGRMDFGRASPLVKQALAGR